MAIYLLIKQHKDTGLKYLCKHVASSFSDCEEYRGSGTYWRKHLKKHGNNVETKCLFSTEDMELFRKVALEHSKQYDVIESKEWANLCDEQGQGGNTIIDRKEHGEKTKKMWQNPSIRNKLLEHLEEQRKIAQPLAAKTAKEKLTGVSKTEQHNDWRYS